MSKRILLIGFVVVCCVAFLPLSANAATSGDYEYEVLGDGICEVTGYNGTETNISIPDTLDGYKVINISYDAFAHGNLTSVQIPEGVESIGDWAFWDNNITSVTIPDSLNYIAKSAFNDNAITLVNGEVSDGIIYARTEDGIDDTTIVSYGGASDTVNFIPPNVTTIGPFAFSQCGLTSVSIPEGVTTIERGAFNVNAITSVNGEVSDGIIYARNENGTDTTTIVSYGGVSDEIDCISQNVTTIGPYAFLRCGLTSVSIPEGVTSIGRAAFNDNAITKVDGEASDGVIYARTEDGKEDTTTIASYGGVLKTVNFIPDDVTTIQSSAFYGLESITLPTSITFIEQYAFSGEFEEFQLPLPLNDEIWAEWLGSNGNTYSSGDQVPVGFEYKVDYKYSIYDEDNCEITGYLGTDTDISIPETLCGYKVINIRYDAFAHGNLTSVIIPDSVESIGDWAFWDNNITSVTIPDSVNYIAKSAFNDNAIALVNGEASDGIIYARNENGIEDTSTIISYGGALDTINFIPQNVTTIGPYAFSQCGLTSVSIPPGVTTIERGAFKYNVFSEFMLPGVNAEWHSDSGSIFHSGDNVSVDDGYKVVSIAEPTPTVAPEEPGAQTGVVTGKLEDASGNPLPNYQVTLYSDPIKTVTDSNGVYIFNNVPYTSHTLVVADENGVEKGRMSLNFTKSDATGATVTGNTVETTYTEGTIKVDFPIIVGDSGISIDEEDVEIVENPQTGGSSMSMVYLIIALGTVLIVSGFFLAKRKLSFK